MSIKQLPHHRLRGGRRQHHPHQAIQTATDAAAGVSRVIVPPGKYLTGGIELKGNIIFELQGRAKLPGTEPLEAYATHEGAD